MAAKNKEATLFPLSSLSASSAPSSPTQTVLLHEAQSREGEEREPEDTIRVRIWKALATADKEISLKQLGSMIGERHLGDLKSHLAHVEKQAKTFGNKSKEWKERRGFLELTRNRKQVKLKKRRGDKGMVYVWLE
jgi:hypothetical protein